MLEPEIPCAKLMQEGRYVSTLREAQTVIASRLEDRNGIKAKTEYIGACDLGLDFVIDDKKAELFEVISVRIRHRKVSEWEEVC